MYVVRDTFQLKFGHYKDVKALFDQVIANKMFPDVNAVRCFTDFTGGAYRFILEQSFSSLAEYEKSLTSDFAKDEWQKWYGNFKEHVEGSSREILKQVI